MSTYNSTPAILVSKFSIYKPLIKILLLIFISTGMHSLLFAQNTRQQILEQRKAIAVNKSGTLLENSKQAKLLSTSNQTLCDFTLTPADAVSNLLSQIIQSLVGSGVTVSNIQTNLSASSDIYGSFSCGSAAKLGIESGLILTTGKITGQILPLVHHIPIFFPVIVYLIDLPMVLATMPV